MRADTAMPATRPQNAALMFSGVTPDTVTRSATRAPRVKRPPNAVTNAPCRARNIARPPRTATNASGVASIRRTNAGASKPTIIASTPHTTPAT